MINIINVCKTFRQKKKKHLCKGSNSWCKTFSTCIDIFPDIAYETFSLILPQFYLNNISSRPSPTIKQAT